MGGYHAFTITTCIIWTNFSADRLKKKCEKYFKIKKYILEDN